MKEFRKNEQGLFVCEECGKLCKDKTVLTTHNIKYKVGDKNKVYHSDFYIPSLNLIVEIKSSWTLKLDVDIEEKKKATIANGFEYVMILDKDYSFFNLIFSPCLT